ncbi:flagellar basal-body rod protein FlgF [Granulicella sibirica]|uniref:flagellar basal-body rod protein FlgF n=1 Tax=Granulicella sibirica TaxID=2479048 RepID=UPI00100927BA|nr:flagellar basal-body rod protein FlgF [Granulicella sibirica]
MDSGLYAACTALMARTDALDSIANNLANSSTGGFRAKHTTFSSVLAGYGHPLATQLNEATNHYGLLSASRLDLQPGSLERTGNELDLGIDGPGFLAVQTKGGTAYTRNGGLQISSQGQLVTASGDPVLGEGGPITIPRGASITISNDGTVSANGAIAGRLKIVEFSATADPQSMGASYYTVAQKDVVASPESKVQQGMLEGSNVNPVASVIELINAQRAAEGMRHAMTMIDSEIDKTAVQDLPRVS